MSKTLNASVKLNTTDAENKLKRLAASIGYINKAINGKSTNALEASLDKQLLAAQKIRKATADAEASELRLAVAKEKQAQAAQKKIDAELQAAEKQIELERNILRQKQQATWQQFQAEQAAYERSVAQEKQAEAQKQQQRLRLNAQRLQQEKETEERIHRDAMAKMRKQYQAEEREAKKLAEQERRLREKQHREELRRIEKETKLRKQANQELSHDILSAVKGAIGAYVGVMGLRVVINTSDIITSAENKLNHINDGDTNATQEQMNTMYAASQRSRMSYTDMMSNVGKSMTLAPGAFKDDINNAIRFQEIMAKTYTLGGASAAEISSSMYQLIQGLGSGILQGDELRSVREGAPLAYQKIEEFAKGIYGAEENLKDLASQGKITSDIVVAAIMQSGEAIDKSFAETKMTFAQAGQMVKNTATKAFEPALQKLNEALNLLAEAGIFDALANVLMVIGKIAYWVASGFAWIAENWNWLKVIILPLITLIGLLTTAMIGFAIAQALVALKFKILGNAGLMAWLKVLWPVFLVIAAIVAVISILNALGITFSDVTGFIVGVLMGAASVIWNIFVTLLTAILKGVLLPLFQQWDNFANFFGNLFNDPITAIIRAFEGLADTVLSILQSIAKGIDAIFGSNLSAAVQGWRDGLSSRADELVAKHGNGTYEEKSNISDQIDTLLSETSENLLWNTSDAYNKGHGWGEAGGQWVTDKLGSIGNSLTNWDETLGTGGASAFDDIAANTGDTAGNTGKMADSMELAAEDLELLYDLAEMEWKKEFTTANITVDMSNYNTVNGMSDLDGIATYLRDGLIEEMSAVANGAYSFG